MADDASNPPVIPETPVRKFNINFGPHVAEEPGGCFRMDEGRSRDSIYRAIAEAFGIPFGTETGMLKLAPADRKAVRDHLRRLNARLVCSDDGRDRERRVGCVQRPGARQRQHGLDRGRAPRPARRCSPSWRA